MLRLCPTVMLCRWKRGTGVVIEEAHSRNCQHCRRETADTTHMTTADYAVRRRK